MDYEKLLRKYIAHVRDCEGIDFLGEAFTGDGEFAPEDLDALKAASEAGAP